MSVSIAYLIDGGARFRLRRGKWQGEYPIAQLDQWLRFYRRMAARKKAGRHYVPDVAALEGLTRKLAERTTQ